MASPGVLPTWRPTCKHPTGMVTTHAWPENTPPLAQLTVTRPPPYSIDETTCCKRMSRPAASARVICTTSRRWLGATQGCVEAAPKQGRIIAAPGRSRPGTSARGFRRTPRPHPSLAWTSGPGHTCKHRTRVCVELDANPSAAPKVCPCGDSSAMPHSIPHPEPACAACNTGTSRKHAVPGRTPLLRSPNGRTAEAALA